MDNKKPENNLCEKDFNDWDRETSIIEIYPKWEVLADSLDRVKKWKNDSK